MVCTRSLWLFPLIIGVVRAALSNRTIDDEYGDSVTGATPYYMGYWNYGPNCTTCNFYSQYDPSLCFDHSWHSAADTSPLPSTYVNFTFVGTALYIFAIIPASDNPQTTTKLTFTMNNDQVGTFYVQNTNTKIAYNVPVYVNESMPNDQYTLQIEAYGTETSYFAFDYAIYTFDDTHTTSHTGAIVGGTIGGVATITILVLVVLFLRRRKYGYMRFVRQLRHGHVPGIAQDVPIEPFDLIQDASIKPFATQMSRDAYAANALLTSPPRPPSPVGSFAQSFKADNAPHRQQLAREVREMERTVTDLKIRRGEEVTPPSTARPADRGGTDAALMAQLEELQREVQRLRAVQEEAMAPPPPY